LAEIKPGEEGSIEVIIDTGVEVVGIGRMFKTVEVRTNDPNKRIVILGISGEVVR